MTVITQNLPTPRRVAVLVPPGSQLVAVIGLIESFDAANRFRAARGRPPLYDVQVVGAAPTTASATAVVLSTPGAVPERVHTLVVGGSLHLADSPVPSEVIELAAALAHRAERVVSVCAGAFVLGELGLLDHRRCTTHWLALEALRRRFPAARVADDAIFTEDGAVLTSAGATAGIDLALHLIRTDAGPGLARIVARAMVVLVQRPGGQSQFGTGVRVPPSLDDRLQRLVGRVVTEPAADHTVQAMARSVGMSPRNFARVFKQQTGDTPAAFVAAARVEAAKRLLVDTDASLDQIAQATGLRRAETLRRTFQRVAGVRPHDYRNGFGGGGV